MELLKLLIQFITYSLIFLLIPITLMLTYRILKKLGVPEYSEKEIDELIKRKFPSWYKYLFYSIIPMMIVFFLLGFYISMLIAPDIQRALFITQETIYFSGLGIPLGAGIIFLYGFFVLSFTLLAFYQLLLDLMFPGFDTYTTALYLIQPEPNPFYRLNFGSMKNLFKIILLINVLSIPFLWASLNDYVQITDKEIFLNSMIPFTGKKYSWGEVEKGELYPRIVEEKNEEDNTFHRHFTLIFKNNETLELWGSHINHPTETELKNIIDKLVKENITLEVTPLEEKHRIHFKQLSQEYENVFSYALEKTEKTE